MLNRRSRPVFLNLLQIRFPVTAVASILHRISGVLMFLFIPVSVYFLGKSLQSNQHFQETLAQLGTPIGRAVLILMAWALLHHLFAGIRYFLIDLEWVISRRGANVSAWVVISSAVVVVALVALGVCA